MANKMVKALRLMIAGWVLWMAGCTTPSSNFTHHVLHPAVSPSSEARNWDPSVYVVVGPVVLPSYLDRPQMVVRHKDHTLSFREYQRWAEPLHEGIARAVAENLSRLMGAENIAIYPFDTPVSFTSVRVFMDVVRFDTDDAGQAVLDVRWGIKDERDGSVTAGHTTLSGVADGAGQPVRTEALSRLVAEFSREVAETLNRQEE